MRINFPQQRLKPLSNFDVRLRAATLASLFGQGLDLFFKAPMIRRDDLD